jgi:murein DD-endopeptidase MepM/ murein hydrolase activator NlpD
MRRTKIPLAAARAICGFYSDHRRLIQSVFACLLVPAVILLVLDQKLPFLRPGEMILFVPHGWPGGWAPFLRPENPMDSRGKEGRAAQPAPRVRGEPARAVGSVGGETYFPPPLSLMSYRVKRGDTLEGISARLGMELDTLSSLNRPGGKGVHILVVGELIEIPNQDGIYITVNNNFEALCAKYNLAPDEVLVANKLTQADLTPGKQLFFPGAKHEGYALSISYGVAIANPLTGGWLSSTFGRREDPFTGQASYHRGIDIAAPEGTVARSATEGKVMGTGYNDILGNFVEVSAPLGFLYIYGHFSRILVSTGARVSQGTPLGQVGSTGYATGPHLHFEVWKDGVPQNPQRYLPGIR